MRKPLLAATVLALVSVVSASPLVPAQATAKPSEAFEQSFLDSFSKHHGMAIEMAQGCTQKAAHPELKALCATMANSQTEQKSEMEGWLQSWYGGKGTAPMAKMEKMQSEHKIAMAKLESTQGNAFDHAFLMSMMQHHQEGMPDLKECLVHAVHPELKQLCGKMMTEQMNDSKKMSAWMNAWAM